MQQVKRESSEQIALFRWADFMQNKYPDLDMMFHIPNGGKRSTSEAARFKQEGVKAGVPDIFLPVPKNKYHGMFIEMKVNKNKTTPKQKDWIKKLKQNNYYVVVCYDWEAASKEIENYMKGNVDIELQEIKATGPM